MGMVALKVDCPACGNINRAARRRCKNCGHSGKVYKYVDEEALEETIKTFNKDVNPGGITT